jgi:hypothetical protein
VVDAYCGPDREHGEVSMLALHLLRWRLFTPTLPLYAILEALRFHDMIGENGRRAL